MTVAPTLPGAVTVRVPAKVNLELRVGPRRPDGFHALATVYQAVSLHDEVSVARWDDWQVIAAGTYADRIPTDGDNLAVRAARLVADRWSVDERLSFRVDKDIPVAGGMAGGSADAAEQALVTAGVDPRTRGEQLDILTFARIAEARPEGVRPAEPRARRRGHTS
jgi:4-diphosphocytidyl-2-C-methyl-D-erythritol kinase